MAENLRWAFSRGDVICAISKNVKWVVVKTTSGNFIDGTKWCAYSVQQLEDGVLTTGEAFAKEHCDTRYVRLSHWDFDNHKEVDDET